MLEIVKLLLELQRIQITVAAPRSIVKLLSDFEFQSENQHLKREDRIPLFLEYFEFNFPSEGVYERHITEVYVRRSGEKDSRCREGVLRHKVDLEMETHVSHAPIQHFNQHFYLAYAWDLVALLLLVRNLISIGVGLAKLSFI